MQTPEKRSPKHRMTTRIDSPRAFARNVPRYSARFPRKVIEDIHQIHATGPLSAKQKSPSRWVIGCLGSARQHLPASGLPLMISSFAKPRKAMCSPASSPVKRCDANRSYDPPGITNRPEMSYSTNRKARAHNLIIAQSTDFLQLAVGHQPKEKRQVRLVHRWHLRPVDLPGVARCAEALITVVDRLMDLSAYSAGDHNPMHSIL